MHILRVLSDRRHQYWINTNGFPCGFPPTPNRFVYANTHLHPGPPYTYITLNMKHIRRWVTNPQQVVFANQSSRFRSNEYRFETYSCKIMLAEYNILISDAKPNFQEPGVFFFSSIHFYDIFPFFFYSSTISNYISTRAHPNRSIDTFRRPPIFLVLSGDRPEKTYSGHSIYIIGSLW